MSAFHLPYPLTGDATCDWRRRSRKRFLDPCHALTDIEDQSGGVKARVSAVVPVARPGRLYRMATMTDRFAYILKACFDDPAADAERRLAYFVRRADSIKGYWKS